jgi:uncharacterized membrane protein
MLGNLGGWHLLVILGVLVIIIAIVAVAVVIIAVQLSRRDVRDDASTTPDPVGQIKRLAQLRDEGLLSDAEYEAKRIEILGRI